MPESSHDNSKLLGEHVHAISDQAADAYAAAGAMAENVNLFCASSGLPTVIRAWFDRAALAQAMGLHNDQQLLLAQTVGRPISPG